MIPKIIHFCWLSGDKYPELVQTCIDSWNKYLPDYQIKCWDAKSFDFGSVPFVKEAYSKKKWAFVSDYIRLYALSTEGGIYLDSDVEALGCIDQWLEYKFFTGIETRSKEKNVDLFIEAAIMGSEPHNPFIEKALELYQTRSFLMDDGSYDLTPIPSILTPLFEELYNWKVSEDSFDNGAGIHVMSTDKIANSNRKKGSAVKLYHWNNRSWIPMTPKEKLFAFLKRLGVKKLYDIINHVND